MGFYSQMIADGNADGVCYFDDAALAAVEVLGVVVTEQPDGCHALSIGGVTVECVCHTEPDCVLQFEAQALANLPDAIQDELKTYEQCPGESGRRPGVNRARATP